MIKPKHTYHMHTPNTTFTLDSSSQTTPLKSGCLRFIHRPHTYAQATLLLLLPDLFHHQSFIYTSMDAAAPRLASTTHTHTHANQYQYTLPDDETRFALELEFIQCLANPDYLHWLALNNYLEDPGSLLFYGTLILEATRVCSFHSFPVVGHVGVAGEARGKEGDGKGACQRISSTSNNCCSGGTI